MKFTWHNYVNRRWQGQHMRPKMAELLLLFHLKADHILSVEDIILFMWPDANKEPDHATTLVRRYIMELRKLYGAGTIQTFYCRGYILGEKRN